MLGRHLLHCRGPKKQDPADVPGFGPQWRELPEHVWQATKDIRLKQFADRAEDGVVGMFSGQYRSVDPSVGGKAVLRDSELP
jgi:hypothetical protein